jgi:pyrroline-5-carboxylate reductase
MSQKSVGFVGSGRIASILLEGWARKAALPARIVVSDVNPATASALQARFAGVESSGTDIAAAAGQEVVLLAVHPPAIKDVTPSLAAALKPDAVLVSLAPKVTSAKLSDLLGGFTRIARMIPNAPSIVGRGFNPIAFGEALSPTEREELLQLFAAWGECPEVPEGHLEAYAIVSAMGPTYFWPQLYELRSLGESFGLSAKEAMISIDKMLWGAVATMADGGLSPEAVMDLVPVKPLEGMQAEVLEQYRTKLSGLMEKLRP